MLWLLEFTRDGHRYRAELRSALATALDTPRREARGYWFVSKDGDSPRRAFEADVDDEDTPEFRDRVISAARERRVTGERRGERRKDAPDDRRAGHAPPEPPG
ncbi:MAG: hypothetical protein AB7T31_14575 [Gemmatimonadales bacterium]